MELINHFHTHLLQDKNKPSKLTIKNYLADVRKFIRWFELRFSRIFSPRLVSTEIVEAYKNELSGTNLQSTPSSASSVKRYLSSLRKFYQFLQIQGFVATNPFEVAATTDQQPADAWHIKEFSNHLFLAHASRATIKNYLVDIRQFISWFNEVTRVEGHIQAATDSFAMITSTLIEEYKTRLLYNAQFEARSVNRKLSSLRKYFTWAQQQGLLTKPLTFNQAFVPAKETTEQTRPTGSLPLEALLQNQISNTPQEETAYSSFGPVRLLQKLTKASTHVFDLLIIWPVVKAVVAGKYYFWKKTGSQVFAPIETLLKTSAVSEVVSPQLITEATSQLDSFVTQNRKAGFQVANLPKSLYAPIDLAIKDFPLHKKIIHHLRFSRPNWYKKYHSYAVVHYLHFGVALIYASLLGFSIYQAAIQSPNFQSPVLASLPASPPRMLAFEGRLNDATNTPITAAKTLRFGLYDSSVGSGSALLWEETQDIQPDNNGNFKTLLGKHTPIYQQLLNDNPTLFLGITIGSDSELTPRQQIATVAYSQDADHVQGLSPITEPDAGTKNVLLALDSGGDLTIGGAATPRFEATGGEFTLAGRTLTLTTTEGTNTNVQIAPDGAGIIDLQKPIQNTTNYSNIPGLEGMVHIEDSVAITTNISSQSALVINQNSTGNFISAVGNGSAKFAVNYLGTGMFAGDLSINGNNLTTNSPTFNLLNTHVVNLNLGKSASSISIGSASGMTTINNELNAGGGLTIPQGKNLTFEGFIQGAIPFIDNNKHVAIDSENFFWQQEGKKLGLGTNTPLFRLDVRDNQSVSSVAQIFNTDTGSQADGLVIKLGNTANNVSTDNEFITFRTAGINNPVGAIRGNGANGIQILNGSFADWAEYLKKEANDVIPFGSLVCIEENGNSKACDQTSNRILGVASEYPTLIAGEDRGAASVPVGLVGLVKTLVSTQNGAIKAGDMITISAQAGIGAKANQAGMVVGRALENYDSTDTNSVGTVLVSVHVGWYDPRVAMNESGNVIPENPVALNPGIIDGIIENIKLGTIEAKAISTQSLVVASENVSIGGQSLKEYVATLFAENMREIQNQLFTQKLVSPIAEIAHVKTHLISPLADDGQIALKLDETSVSVLNTTGASSSAVASIDNQGNASFSGTLRARRIIADEIQGLNIQAATVSANYITNVTNVYNVASPSGTPSQDTDYANLSNAVADTPTFSSQFAKFNNGLIALGGSSFTDIGISGTMRFGEGIIIADTSINTIGTELSLQPLRQGDLSIMGGLVRIDTEGNLNVQGNATFAKDVTVQGALAASIIAPLPNQDVIVKLGEKNQEAGIKKQGSHDSSFMIHDSTGSAVLTVDQLGDIIASGAGKFGSVATKAFTIIRGAQADTSLTRTVADGSAGVAVIAANERERTIVTPFMKPDSLIYITAVSNTQGVTPYIARQTADSFTIQIPKSITKDIKLNWWIVN